MFSDAFTNDVFMTNSPTKFLDMKTQAWSCGSKRWREKEEVKPQQLHRDGSSVHFIVWNETTQQFDDVVYIIGGNVKGESACNGSGVDADYLDLVEKLVRPDPVTAPTWQTVDHMLLARVNHNAVIGLDGAIYVFGGQATVNNVCVFRKWGEMYRPPEVFDDATGMVVGNWLYLAQQTDTRQYHSVANLLPSGKIISAGGVGVPLGADSEKSLEVFVPPYQFAPNLAAPVIDASTLLNPHSGAYPYGSHIIFEVTLDAVSGAIIDRLALIRNGNSTHAFDSDQRYVELRVVSTLPLGGGRFQVDALAPVDGYMAPPGFYMFSVVDSNQMASQAVWVRVL